MSTLRRAWPYCFQYNSISTTWAGTTGYHLPGESFNNSAYCEGKGNDTVQLKECEDGKQQERLGQCQLCCSLTTDGTEATYEYYDAPDGTTCNAQTSNGCLDKKCETPLHKLMLAGHPGWTTRINFDERATTTIG
uniref:Uncharacterized protein n=1 Tax=Ornithodoros parkeri TaxID=140564 RepID=A6N9U2_ORNPR|nr:hypothetical protein [Ornithodoros parkeri]